MLKILVADDHEVVRRGLKDILAGEFHELEFGDAGGGDEAIQLAGEKGWDLVLLDILMPGPSIVDVIEGILKRCPAARILILTALSEHEYAVRTLKAGAHGYITKQYASDELIAAVKQLLAGENYLSKETVAGLTESLRREKRNLPHEKLSPREMEILLLIASGKSVKEIADELGVSDKTVGTHISRIKEKTKLMSYVEMTRYAIQHGLTD